jgi:hypothetical protein
MSSHLAHTTLGAALFLSLLAVARSDAQATARPDTIDVPVGSPLVDFSKHRPGASIAYQEMTSGAPTGPSGGAVTWRFTFADSGATSLLLVRPEPERLPPGAPRPAVTVFDRSTLAMLRTLDPATLAPRIMVDGGTHVHGQVMSPNGPVAIDATLDRPAFYAPLADLVAESLPRRLGMVYRLPMWGMPRASIETHLYEMVRREDVTVRGKSYPQAWVLEDRSTDGRLLGTMWLTDGPPNLVRWLINRPDGAVLRLDQEAVDSRE